MSLINRLFASRSFNFLIRIDFDFGLLAHANHDWPNQPIIEFVAFGVDFHHAIFGTIARGGVDRVHGVEVVGIANFRGDFLDAFILEGATQPWRNWTLFGRAERTDNNELTTVGGHAGPVYTVAKVSAGVIRDFAVSDHVLLGVGALYSRNFVPDALSAAYGGDPSGAMAFLRLKLR